MVNSRNKGAMGERELARKLRELGYDTRRGQQYSGANGDADVVGLDGVHIEVKRVEKLRLWDSFAQSKKDARKEEIPVVMHRANNCPWIVILGLDDFIDIYKKYYTEKDDAAIGGGTKQ